MANTAVGFWLAACLQAARFEGERGERSAVEASGGTRWGGRPAPPVLLRAPQRLPRASQPPRMALRGARSARGAAATAALLLLATAGAHGATVAPWTPEAMPNPKTDPQARRRGQQLAPTRSRPRPAPPPVRPRHYRGRPRDQRCPRAAPGPPRAPAARGPPAPSRAARRSQLPPLRPLPLCRPAGAACRAMCATPTAC